MELLDTHWSAVSGVAQLVCYWIVLNEVSAFVMGFKSSVLKIRNYVLIAALTAGVNLTLTVALLPVMACIEPESDKVF